MTAGAAGRHIPPAAAGMAFVTERDSRRNAVRTGVCAVEQTPQSEPETTKPLRGRAGTPQLDHAVTDGHFRCAGGARNTGVLPCPQRRGASVLAWRPG